MPTFSDNLLLGQTVLQANLPGVAIGPDDITFNLIAAVAAMLDAGYQDIAATAAQKNLATATGAFLDDQANQVGVYRIPAAPATGTVVLTLSPGPATAQPIPIGTVVSTGGSPSVFFATTATGSIPVPGTTGNPSSSAAIPIAATPPGGAASNVAAAAIALVSFQLAPGVLTVTNASPTTGGLDAESDSALRARAQAASGVKYGAADLQAAVVAVSGVYDAWLYDPSAPYGTDPNPSANPPTSTSLYTCYWCDSSGAQPGAGTPNTGVALAVQNALLAQQPPGVIGTLAAFTVVNLTVIAINYRVPAGIASGVIVPLIQAAVKAYIQGLVHNQIPDRYAMYAAVQAAVGGTLTQFDLTATTPSIGSASHTIIYRSTGVASTVVVCTAV